MSMLTTLLKSADRAPRSSAARMIALVLAVATPLLVAGIAVSAFSNAPASSAGAPDLPAAVVNLDAIYQPTVDGTVQNYAFGKVLTSQLMSGASGSGFHWTITDAAAAQKGLDDGAYAAVVTIPETFSQNFASTLQAGQTPTAASLAVETNGAQSYVADLLASALATNVHDALSTSLTQGYVKGLLGGLTTIHSQLAETAAQTQPLVTAANQVSQLGSGVASGLSTLAPYTQQLSSGLATASSSVAALPKATKDLNDVSVVTRDASGLLTDGLKDTASKQHDIEKRQAELNQSIATLATDLPTLTPAQITNRVAAIQKTSDDIALSSLGVGLALDVGTVASGAITAGSGLVTKGTTALADSTPALASGISDAATGAASIASGVDGLNGYGPDLTAGTAGVATGVSTLSTGLATAAANIPNYTDAQQVSMAAVATSPVTTTISDSRALPAAQVATASVMVPVALWIGALALYLLLTPFTVQALASSASAARILRQSLLPALGLAVLQALAIIVGLTLMGVTSANPLGSVLFVVGLSVAFVAIHQGLVALFGRIGRMISLAFLVLQVVAAGVLVPATFSPGWLQSVSSILPLSAGVRGLQGLLTGAGSDGGAAIGGVAFSLLVVTAVGVAFTLVAISRRRSVTSLS